MLYTMEYHPAVKINDKTWRHLKCILQSERNQFKDTTGYLIPTVENLAKLLHGSIALTSILGVKKLAGALN